MKPSQSELVKPLGCRADIRRRGLSRSIPNGRKDVGGLPWKAAQTAEGALENSPWSVTPPSPWNRTVLTLLRTSSTSLNWSFDYLQLEIDV